MRGPAQALPLLAAALAIASAAACATPPVKPWLEIGGPEERAKLTLEVKLTLKHDGASVQTVSMPAARALLQGRVAKGRAPEIQIAVVDVQIDKPKFVQEAEKAWTTYPPLTTNVAPGAEAKPPARVLGAEIGEQDALFMHTQWTSALLVPGLVAIGRLPPPPTPGSCAQVVLTELGRAEGEAAPDLFELELMLALLSGTMSPPGATGAEGYADSEPDPGDALGRCNWRVAGQEGDVATVTTLTARMSSKAPGQVDTQGVLKTLRTNSYDAEKASLSASTQLRPRKLFPSAAHLTVTASHPLPAKVAGARQATYVYEITLRLAAVP